MMANRIILCAVVLCLGWGSSGCRSSSVDEGEARLDAMTARFLERYDALHPEEASLAGVGAHDRLLSVITPEGLEFRRRVLHAYQDSLRALSPSLLSLDGRIDRSLLLGVIGQRLWDLEIGERWKRDPLWYDGGQGLRVLLERETPDRAAQLVAMGDRLEALPAWYAQVHRNIGAASTLSISAASQHAGAVLALMRGPLRRWLDSVEVPAGRVHALLATAEQAQEAHLDWLHEELPSRSTEDVRLSGEQYRTLFSSVLQASLPPVELLRRVKRDLERTLMEMGELARGLDAEWFPQDRETTSQSACIARVLRRSGERHATSDSTMGIEARHALDEALQFLRNHQLLTMDPHPLAIEILPPHARGSIAAQCIPVPGGTPRIQISPASEDWMAARREAWYREYNGAMLRTLMVHEAVPGHGWQWWRMAQRPARRPVRQRFPNLAMAEGWACYCERMMSEAGFGGPEERLHALKMRVRVLVSAWIDLGRHMGTMTDAEAWALMKRTGFGSDFELRHRWERQLLSPVRMSAFYAGMVAIEDARDAERARRGKAFSLREFHERLLDWGPVPPDRIVDLFEAQP